MICFTRKTARLVLLVTLACLATATGTAAMRKNAPRPAESLVLPEAAVRGNVRTGKGRGSMHLEPDRIRLTARSSGPGAYPLNMIRQTTVLDYLLPEPVPLPGTSDRLAMRYKLTEAENKGGACGLRVIVEDHRGARWAVGTRLSGKHSALRVTAGYERLQTHSWTTHELGRRDPLVMVPLDRETYGQYDAPLQPLKLAGFRLEIERAPKRKDTVLDIRALRSVPAGHRPEPYWLITEEMGWLLRHGHRQRARFYGRFGWGPDSPGPYLKAADLKLRAGEYLYCWKILELNDWDVVRAGRGKRTIETAADPLRLNLPLLAKGTYRLHLGLRRKEGKSFHDFRLLYVVIRNSRGAVDRDSAIPAESQLLRIHSSSRSAVFPAGKPAGFTLRSRTKGTIKWSLESADQKTVADGKSAPGKPVGFQLDSLREKHAALWLRATLLRDGTPVDLLQRTLGFAGSESDRPVDALMEAAGNLQPLTGEIRRTKGDWGEGFTPVATNHDNYMRLFSPWLDEAHDTGYNIVELSAPWFDLEPLPGVYQFHYLDRLIAAANRRGLHVMLRVHPSQRLTPAWVRRSLMQDQRGLAHGLWNGANKLFFSAASPELRHGLHNYLQILMRRYRNVPGVAGITLTSLFFDHDLVDQPWVGQYVDYSEAMRRHFVNDLKRKYDGSLSTLCDAWEEPLRTWAEVTIPEPAAQYDADGRLQPRLARRWQDWVESKLGAVEALRLGAVAAARDGKPGCRAGLYSTGTIRFYIHDLKEQKGFMPQGHMEASYPQTNVPLPVRFEPHSKIARTTPLVDVGMTNILMAAEPGTHSFFNYWRPEWELASRPAPVQKAEHRLQQWFAVVDRLANARSWRADPSQPGVYLRSLDMLRYSLQHTFSPRLKDYLKPYQFSTGRDNVHVQRIDAAQVAETDILSNRPYLYVPYAADTLSPGVIEKLARYTEAGGRLVLEATSGYRSTTGSRNALAEALGAPEIMPQPFTDAEQHSQPAAWHENAPIRNVPLAFRTQPFEPPVENQPTPFLHNITRAYLRPFRIEADLPHGGDIVATYEDGTPAAVQKQVGKGSILLFAGIVDWLSCPGLAAAVDRWGKRREMLADPVPTPDVLCRFFRKDETVFALGRRFIGHADLSSLKGGRRPNTMIPKGVQLSFPAGLVADKVFTVRRLLEGRKQARVRAQRLTRHGLELELEPGQAFFLQLKPVDSEAEDK